MNEVQEDRLFELLTDKALVGLSEEEFVEFNRLKKQFPKWENDFSLELAAAAIGLSNLDKSEPLPEDVRSKVLDEAERYFSRRRAEMTIVKNSNADAKVETQATNRSTEIFFQPETRQSFFGQWLGWAVAAAACVALGVNLWLTNSRAPKEVETVKTVEVVKSPTPELSATQQREQLLASASDVVQKNWTSPKNKDKILGDIVWSNARQKGFLRLRGLPVTDPNKEAYQLWIVDKGRSEKKPLNGGVFAVGQTGEVVIPIDAELRVITPKEFNITKEKPGGVIESSPERVVAIAKV